MLMGSSIGGRLCGSFIEKQEKIDEVLNNELHRNENVGINISAEKW